VNHHGGSSIKPTSGGYRFPVSEAGERDRRAGDARRLAEAYAIDGHADPNAVGS
jgi:hypothetical protein